MAWLHRVHPTEAADTVLLQLDRVAESALTCVLQNWAGDQSDTSLFLGHESAYRALAMASSRHRRLFRLRCQQVPRAGSVVIARTVFHVFQPVALRPVQHPSYTVDSPPPRAHFEKRIHSG